MTILDSFAMAFRRHPIQILLELGFAGLLIVLAVGGFSRVAPGLLRVPDQPDFEIYYQAARALNLGQPLYVPDPPPATTPVPNYAPPGNFIKYQYRYPPVAAVIARPLAVLTVSSAKGIWYLLNLVFLALSVALTCKLVGSPRPKTMLICFGISLAAPPVYDTLMLGQINLLLLLLIIAAIYAVTSAPVTLRREVVAGVCMGVAAAIKIYPLLLGFIFIIHRRFVSLVSMVLTVALLGILGIIAGGGWPTTQTYLFEVLPNISSVLEITPSNQNAQAVFARLFSVNLMRFAVLTPDNLMTITVPPIFQAPQVGIILGIFSSGIILLTPIIAAARQTWHHRSREVILLHWSLLLTTLLLITPTTWDHYYVLLLLPLAVLWIPPPSLWRYTRLTILIAGCLLVLHRYWRRIVLQTVSPLFMLFGFLGVLILWLTILWLMHRITAQAKDVNTGVL